MIIIIIIIIIVTAVTGMDFSSTSVGQSEDERSWSNSSYSNSSSTTSHMEPTSSTSDDMVCLIIFEQLNERNSLWGSIPGMTQTGM